MQKLSRSPTRLIIFHGYINLWFSLRISALCFPSQLGFLLYFVTRKIRLSETFHLVWWIHCKQHRFSFFFFFSFFFYCQSQIRDGEAQWYCWILHSWTWQPLDLLNVSCTPSSGNFVFPNEANQRGLTLLTFLQWNRHNRGGWNNVSLCQTFLPPNSMVQMETVTCSAWREAHISLTSCYWEKHALTRCWY